MYNITTAKIKTTGINGKRSEPKPAPEFILDPTVDDFYKFTRDSFRMENYEYTEFTGKIPVAL